MINENRINEIRAIAISEKENDCLPKEPSSLVNWGETDLYKEFSSKTDPRENLTWRMNEIRNLMNYFKEIGLNNEESLSALSEYNDRFYFSDYKKGDEIPISIIMRLSQLFILHEETGTFLFSEKIVMPEKVENFKRKLKEEKEFDNTNNEILFLNNIYENIEFGKITANKEFRILSKKIESLTKEEEISVFNDMYHRGIVNSLMSPNAFLNPFAYARAEPDHVKILLNKNLFSGEKIEGEKILFIKDILDNKLKEKYVLLKKLFLRSPSDVLDPSCDIELKTFMAKKRASKVKKFIKEEVSAFLLTEIFVNENKSASDFLAHIDVKMQMLIKEKSNTVAGSFLESLKNKVAKLEKINPTKINYWNKKNDVWCFDINLLDYVKIENNKDVEKNYKNTLFEVYLELKSAERKRFLIELRKPENKEYSKKFIEGAEINLFKVKDIKKSRANLRGLFTEFQLNSLDIVYTESNNVVYERIFKDDKSEGYNMIFGLTSWLCFLFELNENFNFGIDELSIIEAIIVA